MNELSLDFKWTLLERKRLYTINRKLQNLEGMFIPSLFIIIVLSLLQLMLSYYVSQYVQSYFLILLLSFLNANTFYYSLGTFLHENSHGLIIGFYLQDFVSFIIDIGMMTFGQATEYVHVHRFHHHPGLNKFSRDSECPKIVSPEYFLNFIPFYNLFITDENPEYLKNKKYINGFKQYLFVLFSIIQCLIYIYYRAYTGLIFRLLTLTIFTSKFSIIYHGQNIAEHYSDITGNFDKPVMSTYGLFHSLLSFNTNYHTEHHICPNIAWYYLDEITKTDIKFFKKHENKISYISLWIKWFLSGFPTHRNCKND